MPARVVRAAVAGACDTPASMQVSSSAFGADQPIPRTYTCRGAGTSPPLRWSGVPAKAKALALVVDDPDAPDGTYVHWIVVDVPTTTRAVSADRVPAGGATARGSGDKAAYDPPCPPSGTHHYRFTVYALDRRTALPQGADREKALNAIDAHAIAHGTLVGTVEH